MFKIWRYIAKSIFKEFIVYTICLVFIILIASSHHITNFLIIGKNSSVVLKFIIANLIYSIPIILPIICFLSSFCLLIRLSNRQECLILLYSGTNVWRIFNPIIWFFCFISLFSLIIISEFSSYSHQYIRETANNILTNISLEQINNIKHLGKNICLEKTYTENNYIDSLLIGIKQNSTDSKQSLQIIIVNQPEEKQRELSAKSISIISSLHSDTTSSPIICSINNPSISLLKLEDFIYNNKQESKNKWLKISDLIAKTNYLLKIDTSSLEVDVKAVKMNLKECYLEFIRRLSLGIAPLFFALFGSAMGISIHDTNNKKSFLYANIITILMFCCICITKSIIINFYLSCILLIMPHIIMLTMSIYKINRLPKGQ